MRDANRKIAFARPSLGQREADAAQRAILSGWVTQGPEVAAFEREFAAYVGAPHACAVSSCTTALHLALEAVGVRPGDEVITVSHSFIATANSIGYRGAVPVFIDVQPDTLNIDPQRITAAITPRTRAILCVHQLGLPCDLTRIVPIAREHGLFVIEDAACAAGSEICLDAKWLRIGVPQGDMACFSFHPRKILTTGDGGMVTTANPAWDAHCRKARQHGMSVPDLARHSSRQVIFESYDIAGYNYRLTDIQAAVGRVQLERMPEMLAARRIRAERYRTLLADVPGLMLPSEPAWAKTNWQSYCVRLPDGLDQHGTMQELLDRGIPTRRGVMCAHREAPYADRVHPHPLTASEYAQDHCIMLPLHDELTESDQDYIADNLRTLCQTHTTRQPCRCSI